MTKLFSFIMTPCPLSSIAFNAGTHGERRGVVVNMGYRNQERRVIRLVIRERLVVKLVIRERLVIRVVIRERLVIRVVIRERLGIRVFIRERLGVGGVI